MYYDIGVGGNRNTQEGNEMKVLTTPQEIRDAAKGKGIAPEALEALIEAAFGPTTTAPELEAFTGPLS